MDDLQNEVQKSIMSFYINKFNYFKTQRIHREVFEEIYNLLNTNKIEERILFLTKHLIDSTNNASLIDDKVKNNIARNGLYQCIGLGTPDLLTGLLILATAYEKYLSKESNSDIKYFLNDPELCFEEIVGYFIDPVRYLNIESEIKKLISNYIKKLKTIFKKDINFENTLINIKELLVEILDKIENMWPKLNQDSSILCKANFNKKSYNVYAECSNNEWFKLRINIPKVTQEKYLLGNLNKSDCIKAILENKHEEYIECILRRPACDDDYEKGVYIPLKYDDVNTRYYDYKFKLKLVLADNIASDYLSYLSLTTDLKNTEMKFDKILYLTDTVLDFNKFK